MKKVILIDLSSIAHPAWHISQADPNPDATSIKTIEAVRRLAGSEPYVAVCCEGGRSFRKDIDPEYKATRPAQDAALTHQVKLAMDVLAKDGFPVWSVKGFEADDLLAAATDLALAYVIKPDHGENEPAFTIEILSSDKDLLQLVGERVSVRSIATGKYYDTTGVIEKLGVNPNQVIDWLALVGDTADNIKGAKGIGPKKATELLTKYGNLDDMFVALTEHGTDFTPALATALREFQPRMKQVRDLITLRTDIALPFTELFRPRTPEEAIFSGEDEQPAEQPPVAQEKPPVATQPPLQFPSRASELQGPASGAPGEATPAERTAGTPESTGATIPLNPPILPPPATATTNPAAVPPAVFTTMPPAPSTAVTVIDQPAAAPLEWRQQLDPRSMQQAAWIADQLFRSRLFSAYGTAAGVLSTILAGRELGLTTMASLRGFHIIESKPTISADLLRALVINSGKAKYFRPTERTATRATWETQRDDDPPVSLSFTIEEAQLAGLVKPKSAWEKDPASMLTARASSKLARLVFADVVFNLYTPDEIEQG